MLFLLKIVIDSFGEAVTLPILVQKELWDFCHLTEQTQCPYDMCCPLPSRESQGLLGAICPFTVSQSEACRSITWTHFKPYICCSFALTSALLWYLFDAHYCDI